jgi:hypothetical protein
LGAYSAGKAKVMFNCPFALVPVAPLVMELQVRLDEMVRGVGIEPGAGTYRQI